MQRFSSRPLRSRLYVFQLLGLPASTNVTAASEMAGGAPLLLVPLSELAPPAQGSPSPSPSPSPPPSPPAEGYCTLQLRDHTFPFSAPGLNLLYALAIVARLLLLTAGVRAWRNFGAGLRSRVHHRVGSKASEDRSEERQHPRPRPPPRPRAHRPRWLSPSPSASPFAAARTLAVGLVRAHHRPRSCVPSPTHAPSTGTLAFNLASPGRTRIVDHGGVQHLRRTLQRLWRRRQPRVEPSPSSQL